MMRLAPFAHTKRHTLADVLFVISWPRAACVVSNLYLNSLVCNL